MAQELLSSNLKMLALLAFVAIAGCSAPPEMAKASFKPTALVPPPVVKTDPEQAKRVFLIINDSSEESKDIGEFYRVQRSIPLQNILHIKAPPKDDIQKYDYEQMIERHVKAKLEKSTNPIDFIVLTKGFPLRVHYGSYSLDQLLACIKMPLEPIANPTEADIRRCLNPYFNKKEAFSSKKFGYYLVTRLDGYTAADAKKLVTNSLNAKASKGPFLFDGDPSRTTNGYKMMEDSLLKAAADMKAKGFQVTLDETSSFVGSSSPVAGYASWGSNEKAFSASTYMGIKFQPGAICETFVSTSGRTFSPTSGGQSLIADLIASGVTGAKGYVSEPYTFALARPDIIFDRYTSGFNLAESYYMASLVLKWKDVVVGDPLCAPYAKK